jgi:uncharacterized protein YuzE
VEINFSRHAKRRAKLYKIPESIVETIIENCSLPEGIHEIVRDLKGFKYPIKVVIAIEDNVCTIVTNYPLKEEETMKVHYDEEIDALYLKLSDEKPDGVIEITEGVNIDTTDDGKLTGIEILKASQKMNLNTILSYTLELDKDVLKKKSA